MGDCDDGYVACASCWFCCHDGLARMSGHCTLVTLVAVDECVEVGTHSADSEPSTSVNATVTVAAERAWGWAVGGVAGISTISKLSSMEVSSVLSSLPTWASPSGVNSSLSSPGHPTSAEPQARSEEQPRRGAGRSEILRNRALRRDPAHGTSVGVGAGRQAGTARSAA